MAIKKYTSGAWVPTTYRRYGTETDTITSLPAQIIGDGQAITSCQISGNTVQNGTPTPEAPVDVVGCGVRTGNLLFKKIVNGGINPSGKVNETTSYNLFVANVTAGDTVTVSNFAEAYAFYGSEPATGSISIDGTRYIAYDTPYTIAIPNGAEYIAVRAYTTQDNTMLNLGSTPLPYEPYGYKLPLTVNGTEYPIYLGQVETTRRIKKLVLTGEEAWAHSASYIGNMYIQLRNAVIPHLCFCDRAVNARSLDEFSSSGKILVESNKDKYYVNVWLFDTAISVTYFKSYLAAQYANGTPVTVWYVLAEPETAVVNEPLMKIGDYADTVSATNIPTTGTPENFDVGTTLKPSEVSLTYHGWHEHTDTKYTQGE